ncbi:GNAT family N-acetyltransferase [Sulfitobacter sp. G21635-S1]|uniref:GNAT family N-acetyltransferase n=1 Tax=Sulfitobacter sp. G21635-S1 TaxID=3014043 RepID=UPI0022AEA91F|nr:GNAT family N-acetyltransferase [Sulfitobacter sp. G21635-S1]MCZ4258511.1 GNAT family N-acetyltransferase [Sulfitobacter sp. G21635-S1]
MTDAVVRMLDRADAAQALTLYNELTVGPKASDPAAFGPVIDHPGTQVLGAFAGDRLVAMATLHLLPNVVWNARPYALKRFGIYLNHLFAASPFGRTRKVTRDVSSLSRNAVVENVVTLATCQGQGFGRRVMAAVIDTAWAANAYKIMLMTGVGRDAVGFYEACGFSAEGKTAMVLRRP